MSENRPFRLTPWHTIGLPVLIVLINAAPGAILSGDPSNPGVVCGIVLNVIVAIGAFRSRAMRHWLRRKYFRNALGIALALRAASILGIVGVIPDLIVGGIALAGARALGAAPALGPVDVNIQNSPVSTALFVTMLHGGLISLMFALVVFSIVIGAKRYWPHNPRRPKQCEMCGYDLRATPTRCPECGTIVLRR